MIEDLIELKKKLLGMIEVAESYVIASYMLQAVNKIDSTIQQIKIEKKMLLAGLLIDKP